MSLTTWRLPADRFPLRLLQLSDCHFLPQPGDTLMGVDTEKSFQAVLEALRRHPHWPPDLLLLTGDLVQEPLAAPYRRLHRYLAPLPRPWLALPGNHDDPRLLAQILCGDSHHCAGQVILGGAWQLIALDSHLAGSHAGRLAPAQLDWLRRCLERCRLPALIALHHPPVAVGSRWMDTMQLQNAAEFWQQLEDFPQVKGIVFGHVHQEFRGRCQDIPLWSAPSTCFQFKPGSDDFALDALPPGWRWFELSPHGRLRTWVERLADLPGGLDFDAGGY